MRWHFGSNVRPTFARPVLRSPGFIPKLALALLALQLMVPIAHGDDPLPLRKLQHKSWTIAEGAPLSLLEIAQGADGNLWLSATDGLYRFDGLSFSRYELPLGSTPTRNNNYSLFELKSGALWAGSWYEGLVRIDGDRVKAFGAHDGLPAGAVDSLTEDANHTVWCVAGGRLLHLVGDHWFDETSNSGLVPGEPRLDLFDHNGTQWIVTTTAKLYFRQAGSGKFQITGESWPQNFESVQLLEDPAGNLWIALVDYGKQQSVLRELNVNGLKDFAGFEFHYSYNVWDAKFDSHGSLWITGSGISRITFRYQRSGGSISVTDPREETLPPGDFASAETHALAEDNEGDMWVTTGKSVDRFRTPELIAFGPPTSSVAGLQDVAAGSQGHIWMRTGSGQILNLEGDRTIAEGPAPATGFNLFEDRTGVLWLNTLNGLFHYDRDRLVETRIPPNLSAVRIRQIMERADGSMLFSFKDLGIWSLDGGRWSQISPPQLAKEQISVVYLDSKDALWVGSVSGRILKITPRETREYSLADQPGLGIIYAFLETEAGLLVSGNDGVAVLHGDHFQRLNFAPDVTTIGLSGMIQSFDGDLWLNTGQGVVHIPRAEFEAALAAPRSHAMKGELLSELTIRGPARLLSDLPTIVRDGSGRLWFNTSGVIAYIDPTHISRNQIAPILRIFSISADGAALDNTLRAPPSSRTLRIQYFGSNLTAPEKVRYRYKLDGVDDDWQDVGSRTEAVYTRLRPGSYSFHVMASNGEGVWSEPVNLKFRVLPTFYQTSWFLIFCCVLAVAFIVLMFRLRLNSVARRLRDRAEERANERIRIARDLHDTLLQGFQGLMLSFHVAVQSVPDDSRARKLLEGALLKADRLVVEGRDRVSRLRSESLEGISLPDALKALGEELNIHKTHRFEVQVTQAQVEIEPQIKDELFCIAREAITNSLRHAEATTIGANVDYGPRVLSMSCYDDGCGIGAEAMESAPRLHYGMLGMRERARRIGAKFNCESTQERGTKVNVCIRSSRAYLSNGWLLGWLKPFRGVDTPEIH